MMPDRAHTDDREKFDHSDHPTTRPLPDDLRAPRGGGAERPSGAEDFRGGVPQREPVTPPDSPKSAVSTRAISGRRNSRIRRLDSRGDANH